MEKVINDKAIPTDLVTIYRNNPLFTKPDSYLWINPNARHTKCLYASPSNIFRDKIQQGGQYVPQFAYYPRAYKTEEKDARVINLFEVIQIMKSKELRSLTSDINEARKRRDDTRKNDLKRLLPYITHSGIFIPRRNDGMVLPGFTYQLDVDRGKNPDLDPDFFLEQLIQDMELEVLIASKSTSGDGVKAILFLRELFFLREDWIWQQYSKVYHSVTDILECYFLETHGVRIDTQMKSISQPLFLFHSPDLYINKNFDKWV